MTTVKNDYGNNDYDNIDYYQLCNIYCFTFTVF
jgi:hypothetical protein